MDEGVNHVEPEVRLWCAVILQAIVDATSRISRDRRGETKQIRDEARAWLLSNSKDFRSVCEMAGINPHAVCEFAEKLRRRNWRRPMSLPKTGKKR
jgi:hypothetical protein